MKFEFTCPDCKCVLEQETGGYVCGNCRRTYHLHEDIPCFNPTEIYYGEVSRLEMQEAIRIAREKGWKASVSDWLGPINPWLIDYISSPLRTTWIQLLSLSGTERILDLGCGWGKISLELASQTTQVVALDSTIERVEFTKVRSEQEGLQNVVPVCNGSVVRLPFMDGYFDWVILNGVLEHIGQTPPLNIEDTQQATLGEIRRILKPGGRLYIGIENRYAYSYFLGERDHGRLRFTSIMPRFIANKVSQILKQKPYQIRTHSYRRYTRMLKQVGFSKIKFYWPIPGYLFPEHIIPLGTSKEVTAHLDQLSILKKSVLNWAKTLGLLKYFIPHYIIVSTH